MSSVEFKNINPLEIIIIYTDISPVTQYRVELQKELQANDNVLVTSDVATVNKVHKTYSAISL